MSSTIRTYTSLYSGEQNSDDLKVTAYFGGKYGLSVQIGIGINYCALAQNQVEDLIQVLTKRIQSKRGYRATDGDSAKIISPKNQPNEGD